MIISENLLHVTIGVQDQSPSYDGRVLMKTFDDHLTRLVTMVNFKVDVQ